MIKEIFIDRVANIVEDCSFDGCNILHAEMMAEKLFKELEESPNE